MSRRPRWNIKVLTESCYGYGISKKMKKNDVKCLNTVMWIFTVACVIMQRD